MTVRITVEEKHPGRVVHVEGQLTSHELEALEGVLGETCAGTVLELGELRSADPAAVRLLRRLREAGVPFHGLPPRLAFDLED